MVFIHTLSTAAWEVGSNGCHCAENTGIHLGEEQSDSQPNRKVPQNACQFFEARNAACQLTFLPVYKAYDYPCFDLYDEHLPKVHHHGAFSKIRSIFTLDSAPLPSYALLDPQSPPSCPRHPAAKTVCVARRAGTPHAPSAWASLSVRRRRSARASSASGWRSALGLISLSRRLSAEGGY
ncbi:hypothetical protein DFH08DRAFT_337949 [Mycena albidolilacea]|uniref:Uncharacterized protein n=1 Tax=Mycena albidolilacea TaxID=1033008 RepID=A0AAD6ZL34_9AGAR|nr:hypothetical protein DFH08DRAFT_337949 [Mycena albidolilacea]